jgi:hypothetical protein
MSFRIPENRAFRWIQVSQKKAVKKLINALQYNKLRYFSACYLYFVLDYGCPVQEDPKSFSACCQLLFLRLLGLAFFILADVFNRA